MGGITTSAQAWPLTSRGEELDLFASLFQDRATSGLALEGDAGVGKTRLAHELLAVAERRGATTWTAVASQTAAAVPLGAIAHLIPNGERPAEGLDHLQLFDLFAEHLAALPQGRVVLLVDDLPLLDATSLVLLGALLDAGLVFLVATLRTGVPLPDGAVALWRSGRVTRRTLDPLSRSAMGTVLHLGLGAPVDAALERDLWATSRGNPLVLRELVLAAHQRGDLVQESGVWRLDAPLGPTRLLSELVEERLAGIDGHERAALELLALCQPVGLDDLIAASSLDAVDALDGLGWITIAAEDRRQSVALVHPIHGEVLRANLSTLRTRHALEAHADRIEAHGARRREDPLRIATWRLDATGRADPQLLRRAALLARASHDFAQVLRLARAASFDDDDAELGLLLGEAFYETGGFDDAEPVLAAAFATAVERGQDDLASALARSRAKNLTWGVLDNERAIRITREARAVATSAQERDELLGSEMSALMVGGRPAEALALLSSIEGGDEQARTRVVRALVEAPALALTGRTEAAIAAAERGYADHLTLEDPLAIAHPGTHIINLVLGLAESGRIPEAIALATEGQRVAVAEGVAIARIWFTLTLGRSHLLAGDVDTARRLFGEGNAVARSTGFEGPARMGTFALAYAAGCAGDAAAARALVDELDRAPSRFLFMGGEEALGRAWAAQAAGQPQTARDTLLEWADDELATGNVSIAAHLLHDVARLGAPASVAARLEELAERSDSPLVAARAVHARGMVNMDPAMLTDAGERLEAMGLLLEAAEAYTVAGDATRRRGDQRAGTTLARRAEALAARCPGARTPGLLTGATTTPLSSREREVCLLAARGATAKEIAERLFLSVRTVNNHLQASYVKLGVKGKRDLRAALGVDPLA